MRIFTNIEISLTSEEKDNALDEDCERSSARVTYNKDMQIVDTNNYYPFGMSHLRDDAPSNFGQGSIKTTKKEDEKMKKKAAEAASVKKYIVVGQSCVTVPQNAFMPLLQSRKVPIWLNETEPVPNRWVDNIGARINFFYNFFLPEKKELKVTLNVGPVIPEGTDEKNKKK